MPLSKMAHRTGVAVLCVLHPRKGGRDADPLEWFGGGTAFGGVARSALLFGGRKNCRDEEKNERFLVQVKSNLGPMAPALRCYVEPAWARHGDLSIATSRVVPDKDTPDDPLFTAMDLE